jgi:hypothetical protein
VKQFAVRDVNEPDKAWYDVEVPEEVSIDFYISEELG